MLSLSWQRHSAGGTEARIIQWTVLHTNMNCIFPKTDGESPRCLESNAGACDLVMNINDRAVTILLPLLLSVFEYKKHEYVKLIFVTNCQKFPETGSSCCVTAQGAHKRSVATTCIVCALKDARLLDRFSASLVVCQNPAFIIAHTFLIRCLTIITQTKIDR